MEIIRTDPGLEFWKDMALQEQGTKGKRGKELRIILPSGYEDLVSCEESDTESEAGTGDEDETEEKGNQSSAPEHPRPDTGTDTQPGSSKVQATVKSFSDARAAGGSQWASQNINGDGKSAGFSSDAVAFVPNTGFNPRVIPDLPPFQTLKPANSSNSTPPASMSTSSTEDQDMHSSAAPPATAATFKVETDTK